MLRHGHGPRGLNANSPKFLKAWFGFRRISTAMGIYVACSGIGIAGCMASVAIFGSMFNTFVFNAVFVGIAAVVWIAFARMPKAISADKEEFSAAGVKACLTNKHLMVTSLAMMLFMAAMITYASQGAAGFEFLGLDPVTAAGWASIMALFGIPCNFIWTWLADRIGKIKVVLVPVTIIGIVCFTLAWYIGGGFPTLALVCAGEFFGFAACAFIKGCVGKIPSIPRKFMGTAGGIQTFFQNLAAYILPGFVFAPLSGGNYVMMFYIVSIVMVLGVLVVAFLMPEFGAKGKLAQENADKLDA